MARHIGTVTIYSNSGQVSALLGVDPPRVTEGYAAWEVVQRPRRLGITVFQGTPPMQMELPIVLDGWADDNSVEGEYFRLEQMARQSQEYQEPQPVRLSGPVPHIELLWVITAIDQSSALGRNDGERTRIELTLTLLQYVKPDLVRLSAAETARSRTTQSRALYTVQDGDSLISIAAQQLGNASRWHEIADMNNIIDPRSLDLGDQLRLPS